ncbi:TetR/AcrR family transcriptional regulator [Acrocarpospora sp. B8E8]|uniref:TetR/AcrR family transcriptional regulator n=1 Tax=Acrocarpospora sp. B8E8 TaxID=3153572 RepID=UPI00325CB3FC
MIDREPQMETLLQGATRLFAALGYDSTTLRQISDALGIDPVKVGFTGSKRDLYLAVIERAYRIETEAMGPAITGVVVADAAQAAAAIHTIVDRYLDFCVEHPEFPALWIHRWLYDAADLTGLERQFSQPLITMATRVLEQAVADGFVDSGVDMEYCVWTLVWCVHGFVQGGVLDLEGERVGPDSAEELARFRGHLHQLTQRVLSLPEDATP